MADFKLYVVNSEHVNPLAPNVPLLQFLKAFFLMFQGAKKGYIGSKWVDGTSKPAVTINLVLHTQRLTKHLLRRFYICETLYPCN